MDKTIREFFEGSRRNKWARALSMFLAFALLCALVVNPGTPSSAGGLTLGSLDLNFVKPGTLSHLNTVSEGGNTYYQINTAQFPVVVVKQSTFAIIWKLEAWDESEKDLVLAAVIKEDSSIDSVSTLEWASGASYDSGTPSGSRGKYFARDGYFYVDAEKLSHIDYGEDNNYDPTADTGTLTIKKSIVADPEWTVGPDTIYQAKIKLSGGGYMNVTGTAPYYFFSGKSSSGSVINFTENNPAIISYIPDGTECEVVEEDENSSLYDSVDYSVTFPITINTDDIVDVTVTNKYVDYACGGLVINKELIIDPEFTDDWNDEFGVNDQKVFEARIRDLSGNNYLVFEKTDTPVVNTYFCKGNTATITDMTGLVDRVSFKVGEAATVENLWAFGSKYRVEEIGTENCDVTYVYEDEDANVFSDATIVDDGDIITVKVTNTYGNPNELTNDLIINKRHDGRFYDWRDSVDADTVYTATIKNQNGSTMRFTDNKDSSYTYRGTNQSSGSVSVVSFSINKPARLQNLPKTVGSNQAKYTVTEAIGANYTISYEGGQGGELPTNGDLTVTVVNSYKQGNTSNTELGSLIVHKTLEGYSQPPAAPFTARIFLPDANSYMKFNQVKPEDTENPYVYDYNGNDSVGDLLQFTEDHPATINGIPSGIDCKVVETPGARYSPKYSPEEKTIARGNNNITVNNVYRPSSSTPDEPSGGGGPDEPEGDDDDGDDDGDDDTKTVDPERPVTPEVTEEDDDSDDDGTTGGGRDQGDEEQPDPTVPGGPNRGAPPIANDPSFSLQPQVDENNNVYYVEIDDLGTALGEWRYNDEEEQWIFDPYPPMADMEFLEEMPHTGDSLGSAFLYTLAGLTLMLFLLSTERKRRGVEE